MFYFVFNRSCFFLKFPKGGVRFIKTKLLRTSLFLKKIIVYVIADSNFSASSRKIPY